MDAGSFSDLCTSLWCCVVSVCASEQKEFGLSLMEFADYYPKSLKKSAKPIQHRARPKKKAIGSA